MIHPRRAVAALAAYVAPDEGRYDKIRLDFNESTTGFPFASIGLPPEVICTYPEYEAFRAQLAEYFQVPAECLLMTNGSDEALAVIPGTYIEPNEDQALISRPTFMMIPHYLRLAQAEVLEIPATAALEYDIPALEAALYQNVKLMIIASPDNPTGAVIPAETIRAWCRLFPRTLFVVDEAYGEFVEESLLQDAWKTENLLVTRTFSKAWGLAALRLGVIIGVPQRILELQCVRSPYSVNMAALHAAGRLLENSETVKTAVQETLQRKVEMIAALEIRSFGVIAGHANFFLLKAGVEAPALTKFLLERSILVRDRSGLPGMWGLIRVSIGTTGEMLAFLDAIDAFRETRGLFFDLDDTLVDTRESYDATVHALVAAHSDKPLSETELHDLRAEGGFNDDWDATLALLARRQVERDYDDIASHGRILYLEKARKVEKLLCDLSVLVTAAERYPLMVVTGRPRDEYLPVWDDRLTHYFSGIVCQDDYPEARRKPAPDILLAAMRLSGKTEGLYFGNSVDDMRAATQAGLIPIGVTTTHSAEVLRAAGAVLTIDSIDAIGKVLMR